MVKFNSKWKCFKLFQTLRSSFFRLLPNNFFILKLKNKNNNSEIWRAVNSYTRDFWVGISDLQSEGSYRFEDGQPATNLMFSWGSGEPNDYGGNEDCVHFSRHFHGLNDGICHTYNPHFPVSGVLCQIPTGQCWIYLLIFFFF